MNRGGGGTSCPTGLIDGVRLERQRFLILAQQVGERRGDVPQSLAACIVFTFYPIVAIVKHHEIEILFRRLRLYDQLGRRAEGLIKTIQRELKERYGADHVRSEIEHMRTQVGRQRREILQLQRAGVPTASAGLLLQRMLDKIDGLCAERDLRLNFPGRARCWEGGVGEALPGRTEPRLRSLRRWRKSGNSRRGKGTVTSTSRPSRSPSTSMPRRRWATANTSSTSRTALVVAGRITSPDCSRFLRTAQKCPPLPFRRAFL